MENSKLAVIWGGPSQNCPAGAFGQGKNSKEEDKGRMKKTSRRKAATPQRGQPQSKESNHPDSESGDDTDIPSEPQEPHKLDGGHHGDAIGLLQNEQVAVLADQTVMPGVCPNGGF